jgi:DNA-binding winged helix-turn-helix (wHTH) protein
MSAPTDLYRFGRFIFDAMSGELSTSDATQPVTRLQPQVAALLTLLLEKPGTVVTRAELKTRLWPDTTVDFDDGLNFAVRQLRLALGDDASAPTFVETLPRRGYRFIAPVTHGAQHEPVAVAARRNRRWLAPAGVGLIAGVLVVAYLAGRPSAAPPRPALAILAFKADTSDSLMAAYRQRLNEQINASARAETVWTLVPDTSAATHVLSGTLTRRDFSVAIFVQLIDRATGRHVWADSILDSYPFRGNSTLTAQRIEQNVARLLSPAPSGLP